MNLISTRNTNDSISSVEAVLKGIAHDGGLFVPEIFPQIDMKNIEEWGRLSYAECAARVMEYYFDLPIDTLQRITERAYQTFSDKEVVPIQKIGERDYVMELFHGPTLAFKDMALQVLPGLMEQALLDSEKDVLILTATSGDTGKAALEGFKDAARTKIAVFFPKDGVSDMQRLQMTAQEGENVYVAAIRGNFDDTQTMVKQLFADRAFEDAVGEKGYVLSSANSINFGRLAPQIAYYIYTYARLVAAKELTRGTEVNVVVPTGNFGNILAAYYAKRMGLPFGKLICASNKNNVLTDFFESGVYAANREFYQTISPSMDILVSSNLERLLFEAYGRNSSSVKEQMSEMAMHNHYAIDTSTRLEMIKDFYADFADEFPTMNSIKRMFESYGYLMDPHTAVARTVHEKYKKLTGDRTPSIIAATASPFKFSQDVLFAITKERVGNPFEAAYTLAELANSEVPQQLRALETAEERFTDIIDKEHMAEKVLENL